MAKKIPEIPSASLADIAFMLLIFFLVTTTMDVDSGLERLLPQWVDPDELDDTPPIRERNIFTVLVDMNDRLMVEGKIMDIEYLRDEVKEFMANPYNDENLAEKELEDIPFFGEIEVTKGIISLRNHEGTTYGKYIAVQNELVGAINDLREELSKSKFGKSYDNLDRDQQSAVKKIIPSKISEAEPKRAGGN